MPAALLLGALALAGCAGGSQPAPIAPQARVYALAGDGIDVFDSGGRLERRLPIGVPSPDWSLLYVPTPAGVEAVDARTGGVLRSLDLGGAYTLARPNLAGPPQGLSPDGRWLALGGKGRFAVVDTAFKTTPALVRLDGDFEFDALSNDGRRLYLAQALPHGYQVRLYDLLRRTLSEPIVDKKDVESQMSGFRVTSVEEPGGRFHFGLYVRPDQPAFVHALPIYDDVGYAFCVFLPWPGYIAPSPDWSLSLTRDGHLLYATSGMLGRVAEVATADVPYLARSLELPPAGRAANPLVVDAQAKEDAVAPGAVLSADESRLYFPDVEGVDVVDLRAFKLAGRLLAGEVVASLVAGADGSVYALTAAGSVFHVDVLTGRSIARFQAPAGVERLLFVTPASDHR